MKIAITGGSGALGRQLIADWLAAGIERIRVASRDEHKHAELEQRFGRDRVQCFVADVRDQVRMADIFLGCDIVVHAAALKRVDGAPYNLEEHRKTNIMGAVNVVRAAMQAGVGRLITVSTDKACHPQNAYGAAKMWAELETININALTGRLGLRASCVRYGNVWDSTGSVVQVWREAVAAGHEIALTDPRMTRFHLTLPQASVFIQTALTHMIGGEIFVPKLPSWRLADLSVAMAPDSTMTAMSAAGRRPGGEKLHEALLTEEEVLRTRDDGWAYLVMPSVRTWSDEPYPGVLVPDSLRYTSDTNDRWLSVEELRALAYPESVPA